MKTLALVLSAAAVVAAADSPFVGTWKLNPAKSHFTGTALTYEQLPSGEMQATAEGQSYKFKTDGKEYPAVFGSTAMWKQVDANTWEATHKMKDLVLSNDTSKLSADGKTLTVNSTGKTPNGTSFDNSSVYQRVSGGPGLAGKWKTTKVNISSPETMEIGSSAGDGLAWKILEFNASVNLKFDGKDYPAVGPTVPPTLTLAASTTGPRSFDLVEKVNGKVVFRGTYTVSTDGKTLTAAFSPEGTNDKVTAVYDRR